MKAEVLVCASPEDLLSRNSALTVMVAFLRWQSVPVEFRQVNPQDIVKHSKGLSLEFCVQLQGVSYSSPLSLIDFFVKNGLIKI